MVDFTIEPSDDGTGAVVWRHGTYPSSSVLAGAEFRQYTEPYPTVAEAQAAYPEAKILEHSTRVPFTIPPSPPAWFDPADAGERWDEDW